MYTYMYAYICVGVYMYTTTHVCVTTTHVCVTITHHYYTTQSRTILKKNL